MQTLKYFLIIFLFVGCQKSRPPEIKVINPADGQNIQVGEKVKIEAKLSDPDILLGVYLNVVSGYNYSDTIIKFKDNLHGGPYLLSKEFTIQHTGTYKIVVGAHGGSSINSTKEEAVYIHAN